MVTRVEYLSLDCRRSATVLWVESKRWHVMLRLHDAHARCLKAKERWSASLTSAQAMARTWTQGR